MRGEGEEGVVGRRDLMRHWVFVVRVKRSRKGRRRSRLSIVGGDGGEDGVVSNK